MHPAALLMQPTDACTSEQHRTLELPWQDRRLVWRLSPRSSIHANYIMPNMDHYQLPITDFVEDRLTAAYTRVRNARWSTLHE